MPPADNNITTTPLQIPGSSPPPAPPLGDLTPDGFDPEKWALLRIRMHTPVPALSSLQATELVWQLFRRSPPGNRQTLKEALDFIGVSFEGIYRPTASEADDGDAALWDNTLPLPVYPGDDRDDDYGWLAPLDLETERDWWAA